ncbi:MAG: hypothetical protein M3N08_00210 [Pseudomonadota bacterium]|nr:hypothetical protein [Pseudomonadota bacterium]
MKRWLWPCLVVLALAACGGTHNVSGSSNTAEFWRPISEPNILMPQDQAQKKLDFDVSQCHCGIYPANMMHSDAVGFSPDRQQLAATSMTIAPDENGQCLQQPSLVVTECMRGRGWETTNCSGRMPLPGGGSLCTAYKTPDQ